MSTDWRALCAELADTLERAQRALRFEGGCSDATDSKRRALIDRARAALAQQEPEVVGPTDEELLSLDQLRDTWNAQADAMNSWDELGIDEIIWWAQRQAIARWGRPSPAPAEGEVAELAVFLRGCADDHHGHGRRQFTRAADLLERQAAPVPVAVSGWQPINTAPKDGTEILASDYDAIEIASWVAPRFDVGITGEWTNREGEAIYPAWWQPLADHPPLPSGEVEA